MSICESRLCSSVNIFGQINNKELVYTKRMIQKQSLIVIQNYTKKRYNKNNWKIMELKVKNKVKKGYKTCVNTYDIIAAGSDRQESAGMEGD